MNAKTLASRDRTLPEDQRGDVGCITGSNSVRASVYFYTIKVILYVLAGIAGVTGALALTVGTRLVPSSGSVAASLDNEFRFFSVFWLFYGIDCFFTANNLGARHDHVRYLAAVMLLAAVARTSSILLVGMPASQYSFGAVLEYIFAVLLLISHRRLRHLEPA
jgi:hypothetical protein